MATIYSATDLTNLAAKYQCCAAEAAMQALKAEKYGYKDPECYKNKFMYLNKASCIVSEYTAVGTLLEEGFTSSATLDLSAFAPVSWYLTGNIVVNGNTIAVLPDIDYIDLATLMVALANAINTGGSGYTATDNLDGTITIYAPGPGSGANGFAISIIINPTFDLQASLAVRVGTLIQMHHINLSTSDFHGDTIITNNGSLVFRIRNGVVVQTLQTQPNIIIGDPIQGSGSYAIVHREITDSLVTVGNIARAAWELNSALTRTATYPGVNYAVWAIYNRYNDTAYFQDAILGRILRLDPTGTTSALVLPNRSNIPRDVMAIDYSGTSTDGNLWSLGATNISVIDPDTFTVINTINNGGLAPEAITYYPGNGTPGTERMYVTYPVNVVEYNMAGVATNPTFYAGLGGGKSIFYSSVFNVLFISNINDTHVVRLDGTLRQTITGVLPVQFAEDIDNRLIIFKEQLTNIHYFGLGNSGTAEFDGALENGTPNVYSDGSENCLTEAEFQNVLEVANSTCCQIDY